MTGNIAFRHRASRTWICLSIVSNSNLYRFLAIPRNIHVRHPVTRSVWFTDTLQCKLDHIDVIITYGATCLTTTVAKSIEFAVFETPSFTQNASVTRDRVTSLKKKRPHTEQLNLV